MNGSAHMRSRKALVAETLALYVCANLAVLLSKLIREPSGTLTWGTAVVVFVVVPIVVIDRLHASAGHFGLGRTSIRRNVLLGFGASAVILPLFACAYWLGHRVWGESLPLVSVERLRTLGFSGVLGHVSKLVFVQILLVGLTEEVFYRGYMQSNLNTVFGKPWTVLSIKCGPALPVAAVLFGVAHILWWNSIFGLLVIIPGIAFGVLREKADSIWAPAIFHGLCNSTMFVLNGAAFPK